MSFRHKKSSSKPGPKPASKKAAPKPIVVKTKKPKAPKQKPAPKKLQQQFQQFIKKVSGISLNML